MDKTIAVLGTGTMGAPMARNLADAGFEVRAWNRTAERAEGLGATVCDDPAAAVDGAPLVMTMLSDGDAVQAVAADMLDAFADGAIWIQASTVGIEATETLMRTAAERGVAFVDAPMLGTKQPAEEGRLTVLASGP